MFVRPLQTDCPTPCAAVPFQIHTLSGKYVRPILLLTIGLSDLTGVAAPPVIYRFMSFSLFLHPYNAARRFRHRRPPPCAASLPTAAPRVAGHLRGPLQRRRTCATARRQSTPPSAPPRRHSTSPLLTAAAALHLAAVDRAAAVQRRRHLLPLLRRPSKAPVVSFT